MIHVFKLEGILAKGKAAHGELKAKRKSRKGLCPTRLARKGLCPTRLKSPTSLRCEGQVRRKKVKGAQATSKLCRASRRTAPHALPGREKRFALGEKSFACREKRFFDREKFSPGREKSFPHWEKSFPGREKSIPRREKRFSGQKEPFLLREKGLRAGKKASGRGIPLAYWRLFTFVPDDLPAAGG
jgi:hypothetical protein